MSSARFNCSARVLQIVLLVTLFLCVALIATACECKHEYEKQVTKIATCGEAGEIKFTCNNCGDSYTEELPKLSDHTLSSTLLSDDEGHWQKCENCVYATEKIAHEYKTLVSSDASTCVKEGNVVKSCVCGRIHTEVLPMSNHSYTIYQKQDDKHWLKCENCDSTTVKVEHEFNIQGAITLSTCVEQGSSIKFCVCGEEKSEPLPLLSHIYTKTAFDEEGHWSICSVCHQAQPYQDKTTHTMSVLSITDAECGKKGEVVSKCNGCDYTDSEELPALEHELDKTTFSSSSTGSGHYYKCNICKKDIVEPHVLENCECPNGYNCEATCYKAGHQDQQCTVCNWRGEFSIPMNNNHIFSGELEYNGMFHWYPCTNGDGACDAHGNESAHSWAEDIVKEPTCTENGSSRYVCECGAEQSGKYSTLPKLEHNYEIIEVITEATCANKGLVKKKCSRCLEEAEEETPALDHVWDAYESTIEGHKNKCVNCGSTQSYMSAHTWLEDVEKVATCTEHGLTTYTCKYCNYTYDEETIKPHNYITDPDSYIDSTCREYGTHIGICSYCNDTKTFTDEHLGYAPHTIKYYPEREMTDSEPGYINHWKCSVCDGYFSSHDCHNELSAEQVFTFPPTYVRLESIEKLYEIAESLSDGTSDNYYQVTATVYSVDDKNYSLMIGEGNNDNQWVLAILTEREYIKSINENDVVTLKGQLFKKNGDVTLTACEIIYVDCGDSELHSISVSVSGNASGVVMMICSEIGEDEILPNINYYNYLLEGDSVIFSIQSYSDAVLQRATINGKPVNVENCMLTVEVTEDIRVEFVFAKSNQCSVTINELNTNNNDGNAIFVDEYISYTYTNGGYNDDGRLHKDSHLTFTADNANITGISITYDADWLENNPDTLDNIINIVNANGTKTSIDQGNASNRAKVTVDVPASDICTVLEYFANASQARVVEITVRYVTNNNIKPY